MPFEQEIISGLTKKIMLFDEYVNGIDCELEKGIQQHPGNKEIENIMLLWKQKFVKKESEMIEKESERACEEVEVDCGTEIVVRGTRKEREEGKETEVLKDKELQKNSECTDWEKHSKISALTPITLYSFDAQLVPEREPLSEFVTYDGPSFDIGLKPTPQGMSTIFK